MSLFKLKKYVVSRMGDTRLGREKLLEAVGEDVTLLLEALGDATAKFADKTVADDLSRKTIKLASKAFLLWREKRVTPESAAGLQPYLLTVANRMIETLEQKPGSVAPKEVEEAVRAAAGALIPIIKPHMKEKNWQLANELVEQAYGSPAFLTFLFNSPVVARERGVLLAQFQTLTAPFGGGTKKRVQKCAIVGCELPRLVIRGAQYCHGHHALKFAAGPPARLVEFLDNPEFASTFKDYVAASHPTELRLLDLLHTLNDFSEITNRNVVKQRAPLIFDRYFRESSAGPHYVALTPDIMAPIASALETGSGVTNKLYEPAAQAAIAHLESLYLGPFRDSPQYAAWADEVLGYEIPPVSETRASLLESAGINVHEIMTVQHAGPAEDGVHGAAGAAASMSSGAAAARPAGAAVRAGAAAAM